MSDRELRRLLNEVIDDIETGKVKLPRRGRLARLGVGLGAPAALAIGMAMAGCDPPTAAYGVPPVDAGVHDAGPDAEVDAGPVIEYGGPEIDAAVDDGAVVDYGVPPVDGSLDDGAVVDYGVPPVDGGAMPEYGSP